jgi:hypothetical protein
MRPAYPARAGRYLSACETCLAVAAILSLDTVDAVEIVSSTSLTGRPAARMPEARSWGSRFSSVDSAGLELAPAAGSVVRGDVGKQGRQSRFVDRLVLVDRDGSRGLVVVAARDDALRIGNDPPS